ncbi:MAG: EF-P beta-lysylation protein EpmB [Gammaproteobacteria bacterium]|nr:EF-P beta-lysylation protein EpmB [Gammaproteobacteria bacterium]MCF6229525.1 EF-P beta-lysylation protein EpmB [Gammaproteobacteria bacterium]
MITRTSPICQVPAWQSELAKAIRDPKTLLNRLNLSHHQLAERYQACKQFPLRVTESYLSRMRPGDPNDPLLLQILPRGEELDLIDGYGVDPVGDDASTKAPGLLHKYSGRCLLITTAACAIHCRYCFRRHFPYQASRLDEESLTQAMAYIADDSRLSEVILSGGDPLSLSDERLEQIITKLNTIPHLKRLRIHTRQPIALPSRVTDGLLRALNQSRLQQVMVLHFNHANEFDHEVERAMKKLSSCDITLLNQSVLLKGVNDSVSSLKALSEKLFEQQIIPYYLHLLDKTSGAAHFDTPIKQARQLYKGLRAELPGYLVPTLVQEQAGEPNKTVIT